MRFRHACCLIAMLVIGCGKPPEDAPVVEQTVTVTNAKGEEQVVPLDELYDADSGAPAFESVLVIDRQRNRKTFVSPDELKGQTPANARYVLVTSSPETVEATK